MILQKNQKIKTKAIYLKNVLTKPIQFNSIPLFPHKLYQNLYDKTDLIMWRDLIIISGLKLDCFIPSGS